MSNTCSQIALGFAGSSYRPTICLHSCGSCPLSVKSDEIDDHLNTILPDERLGTREARKT